MNEPTNREEAYVDVISLLMNHRVNKKWLLHDLATTYPEVFLALHNRTYDPVVFRKDLPPTPAPKAPERIYSEVFPDGVHREEKDLPYWARSALYTIRNNEKIQAIKLTRALTGCGLREAKDYVDELQKYFAPETMPKKEGYLPF